ncbi:uncharacterized protein LOC106012441 [Aplysia californica]|uniref:Uncharacterized protein LOC106012441 n=1 Tax=Aplysia californica TaxID=6500 RepID=A0ABM1A4W4_APLCA|nr:uncharacterized protein LOC106012441 [Aplysia californica]
MGQESSRNPPKNFPVLQNMTPKQKDVTVKLTPPKPWINPAHSSAYSIPARLSRDSGHDSAENIAPDPPADDPQPPAKRRRTEPSANSVASTASDFGLRPLSSSQTTNAGDVSGGDGHVFKKPMETKLWTRLREQSLRERRDNLLHYGTVHSGDVNWEMVEAVSAQVFSLVGAFVANFQEEFYTNRFSPEERIVVSKI